MLRAYRRRRFPPEVIGYPVWLNFRFPLGLRMVEEMLAMRGLDVTDETIRRRAEKFGLDFAAATGTPPDASCASS